MKNLAEPGKKKRYHLRTEPRTRECELRYLDGKVRYDFRLSGNSLDRAQSFEFKYESVVYTPERTEKLNTAIIDSRDHGIITAPEPLPYSTIDLGLGLRAFDENTFIAANDIEKFDLNIEADGSAKLQFTSSKGLSHTWMYRSSPNLQLVAYEVVQDGFSFLRIAADDFRTVEGISLPFRISQERFNRSHPEKPIERQLVVVEGYKLGVIEDVPESFMLSYPLRTQILDARLDKNIVIKSKPRTLNDKEIIDFVGPSFEEWPGWGIVWVSVVCLVALGIVAVIWLVLVRVRSADRR